MAVSDECKLSWSWRQRGITISLSWRLRAKQWWWTKMEAHRKLTTTLLHLCLQMSVVMLSFILISLMMRTTMKTFFLSCFSYTWKRQQHIAENIIGCLKVYKWISVFLGQWQWSYKEQSVNTTIGAHLIWGLQLSCQISID